MSFKTSQNAEVYSDVTSSGKSLLQLYMDLKEDYRKVVAKLAAEKMGIK